MKSLNPLKAPFGMGKYSSVKAVRYRQRDDAFEVEFDDGLSFLERHRQIRQANGINPRAVLERVELDHEFRHGFTIRYDNGQVAEVSWAFVREMPPNRSKPHERVKSAELY